MKIEIVVDDRERAGGLAEAIAHAMHRAPRVMRLALGDVQIGPALRVERKAAADFVASLASGRLMHQLNEQLRAGGRVVLIVEGEFTPQALGGMAEGVVRQAILTVTLDLRIPVLRARDVEETARWIETLARHEEATAGGAAASPALAFRPAAPLPSRGPLAGHAMRRPKDPRAAGPAITNTRPPDVAHAELARIPGVGPRKAQLLLDHFGSLMAIRAATSEALASVPGIGPAVAEAVHRRFGG